MADDKKLEELVPGFDSEKLCEIIVCNRYLGLYKEVAEQCMQELSKRRLSGDAFDFETYIENSYNELPQLKQNSSDLDLLGIMKNFVGIKK